MADTMSFDLVSPERLVASVDADMVQIPGMEGDLTAMPQHAPLLTTLRPGVVSVKAGSETTEYFVTGGFAEISPTATSVLAEEAMERSALTRGFLEEKLAHAEKALDAASDAAKLGAGQRVLDFRAALDLLG